MKNFNALIEIINNCYNYYYPKNDEGSVRKALKSVRRECRSLWYPISQEYDLKLYNRIKAKIKELKLMEKSDGFYKADQLAGFIIDELDKLKARDNDYGAFARDALVECYDIKNWYRQYHDRHASLQVSSYGRYHSYQKIWTAERLTGFLEIVKEYREEANNAEDRDSVELNL